MNRFVSVILIFICTSVSAGELHVSAPKSVKGAFIEISELFEKKNPEWKVKLRIGKPSELGRLVEQGGGTDVFLLSNEKTIQNLKQKNLVQNVQRFLADDLVVIGPAASTLQITGPEKLAFPELKGVALFGDKHPIGKVTRAYLRKTEVLSSIIDKVIPKKNIKEVITGVSTGTADWGIVYASDIIHAKGVKVIWKIPEKDIPPEIYYLGSVTKSPNSEAALLFLETLNSTIALKIFENAGLRLLKN